MNLREAEDRALVVIEAMTWLRTPYHDHGRIKGVGVDCAQILCAVYEAVGLVPHIDLGNYPREWHLHHGEELYLNWLLKVGAHEVDTPEVGDMSVFRFGRTYSHGAILVEKDVYLHSYINRGVILNRRDEEPLDGRLVKHWSIF